MNTFPVFLLPKGEIMITAKIEEDNIKILGKTIFPSNKKYAISNEGLSACLDNQKRIVIYGQLTENGGFDFLKIINIGAGRDFSSIEIVDNFILLGGSYNALEIIMKYPIDANTPINIEMPFEGIGKSTIGFLIRENKLSTIINDLFKSNFILEYDVSEPEKFNLTRQIFLQKDYKFSEIFEITQNHEYVAFISNVEENKRIGCHIDIFKQGEYEKNICFTKWYESKSDIKNNQKLNEWKNILFLSKCRFLLISCSDYGIGVFHINDYFFEEECNNNAREIYYFNPWGKKVIKISESPINPEYVIIVFEEENDEYLRYSYSHEAISPIIENFDLNVINIFEELGEAYEFDDDYIPDYNDNFTEDFGLSSDYCEACQESPCMCSDREKSSTIYDF